jgi:class 3 adenylate cyclase/tetratricopeptide (TPR) repeat protein
MNCPICNSENADSDRFCRQCGTQLLAICPHCRTPAFPGDRFCGACGLRLETGEKHAHELPEPGSERKYVTVLFTDISGYTAIAQKLDPEEVRDIVRQVFATVVAIISKYGGSIEKYAGDAIMAVFGVPKSHEDDPVRAIKAAREIHFALGSESRGIEEKIGNPLSMHIGINTGLVVTGQIGVEKGMLGVSGDTVNIASRLCDLAAPRETLVGYGTYTQAEGFFNFEQLQPINVKGRTGSVVVYRVLSSRELPTKTHRLSGLRSSLIGRREELTLLTEAVNRLTCGEGTIFTICGDAGTGKSRLIEEFKSTLDLDSLQWLEGNSYPYTQSIPYYPLIDLLNRAFGIDESDSPEVVRGKAEANIKALVGDRRDIIPYLGGLLSISYSETEETSPEDWRHRLRKAAQGVLSALVRRTPTIVCIEDLHWADPSSLDLLRSLLCEANYPALFLCAYRPPLSLLSDQHARVMVNDYHEIRLQDLSNSELMEMVESLLGVEDVPEELKRFIQEKVGGNPFYVEEVINSLIESEILRSETGWQLCEPIGKADIPATVHGIVSARVDRLNGAAKLLLQEASVIGKTFPFGVLKRITALDSPDQLLERLEQLDLVRATSVHPDREYSFKHSLTQEAVYNGLLIKHRKDIHERVGLAMEQVFRDRLPEFWETLGLHFKQGRSMTKAIDYLMKSGEKSFRKCALEESHQHYKEAFDLLLSNSCRSREDDILLVELLIEWASVFYYRGCFKDLAELLLTHKGIVELLDDKAKTGMFYAWLGFAIFGWGENLADSYQCLHKALELGEVCGNKRIIAYSCAFLIKTCAELGEIEEAVRFEERSRELIGVFPSDAYLYLHYFTGKAYIAWFTGNKEMLFESGKALVDYGRDKSNIRILLSGSLITSVYHHTNSDTHSAVSCLLEVLRTTEDPYHAQFGRALLGMYYIHLGKPEDAEKVLTEVIKFGDETGTEYMKTFANLFLGLALSAQGRLNEGVGLVEESAHEFLRCQRNIFYCMAEIVLGTIYMQILQRSEDKKLSLVLRNLVFFVSNRPFAADKAQLHLEKAIQLLTKAGAKGFLGEPYLQLGMLHKIKGRAEEARQCAREAVQIYQHCGSKANAKRAREILESIGMS